MCGRPVVEATVSGVDIVAMPTAGRRGSGTERMLPKRPVWLLAIPENVNR